MINWIYIDVLYMLSLRCIIHAATRTQEVSYLCLLNSTDSSVLHFTFRLITNNDTVVGLQAYDANTKTPNQSDKKVACKSSEGNGTMANPLKLSITIDTDDPQSVALQRTTCGVLEVTTGTSYKFRIRSVGDFDLDTGTDAFFDVLCDKNNILGSWVSTGPLFTSSLQTVLLQEIRFEAKLKLINEESKFEESPIALGTTSYLQLIYNSKITTNQFDSSGTDFWVLLPKDSRYTSVFAFSAVSVHSHVSFWKSPTEQITSPFTLGPNTEFKTSFNVSVGDIAVRIRSTENIFLMVTDSVSQYMVYPKDSLDNLHTILALNNQTTLFIVATSNSTIFNISSPVVLTITGKRNVSGASVTLSAGEFDVYKIVGNEDITGTTISSNFPLAVYRSHPFTDEDNEYVFQQLPGYAKLGTEFVVFPSNGTLKCLAVDSGVTTIRIRNDSNSGGDIEKRLNIHESVTFIVNSDGFTQVKSDKKYACVFYNIGNNCDNPSISLPPKQQWSNSYIFSVNITDVSKYTLFITIRNGSESNVRVNGDVLSGLKWTITQHVKSDTSDSLVSAYVDLPSDIQSPVTVTHSSSTFMVVVARESKDGKIIATVPPGLHLSDIYLNNDPSCTPTNGYQGDLVDNDCDGVVDEDADIYIGKDLYYTQTEQIVPTGMRPVNCIVKPNNVWNDNGIYRVITQSSGCIPEGTMKNPFTPATNFHILPSLTNISTVYETGNFKIPRFENQPIVFFRCRLDFCFSSKDKSCSTEICSSSSNRRKRDTSMSAGLISNTDDMLTSETGEKEYNGITLAACLRNTNYLVASACLIAILLVAVCITFCLYIKVKMLYKKCELITY